MANNNSYIFNESATWVINGVNTTFTLVNNIETIESLRIGYIEYTDFTFSGNTIILADAPSVINGGVYVDYFFSAITATFDSVNLLYDEVLIGDVDGVNKVFYSVYPIDKIDELRIWGISYSWFTFNWRALTLQSAPSSIQWAPHIDYYRKDVNLPIIDSGVTLSELRASIYLRIGQTVTSLQFPQELADEYISEGVTRISKMKRDRNKRGIFSFHKASDSQVISTDGNKIYCSVSKYLPSKGVSILEGGNVVYYSQKGTDYISSLSNLEVNDIGGKKVQFGYKLSKNINKISEVFIDGFKLTPADFAEYRMNYSTQNYCVYNSYLFLPYGITDGSVITVVYVAEATSKYSDSDIIDFDGDYLPVIKSFVLWNMYKDREDDRKVDEKQNYMEVLREYKRELSKQYDNTSWVFQSASPLNRW